MSKTVFALVAGSCLVGTVAWADPGTLNPNGARYRVSSAPAATGRAGNATLAARALLNKDGSTDVDITTGQLDSTATAPGNISKVQIKTYNGAGDVQWTKNYNSLTTGGRLHYNFPDLHRGQPVQVQTNIDKIDKRTDVVTVTGNVKLRPDLAVRSLNAPARAAVGSHVDISATVQEINGDVGATGDCKLFVDGTQVDQALGIWVDNGGTVTCAFNYQFTVIGTHALKVAVDGVVPADYDTSNNSQSGSIDIFDNTNATVYWNAYAWGGQQTWDDHYDGRYQLSDGTYPASPDWSNDYSGVSHWSGEQLWGWSPVAAQFPLQSVNVTVSGDGNSSTTSFPAMWAWWYGDSQYGGGCDERYANGYWWWWYGYSYATMCSESWNGVGYTWMYEQRNGGDVTYHSHGYDNRYYDYSTGTYGYTWNDDTSYTYGDPYPFGSQVTIAPTWVDANGTNFAPVAAIDMQPLAWAYSFVEALTCYTPYWSWGYEQDCESHNTQESGAQGWASGTTN